MSVTNVAVPQPARPSRRPTGKVLMHWVRRGHLYFGLFLFPWAVLYGVTAFLFNHPTVFADRPTNSFGREVLAGTPMENPPDEAALAAQVVAALQARAADGVTYKLVRGDDARFSRDNAFATVKAGDQTISVLLDVWGDGGTIRGRTEAAKEPAEKAPFAVGPSRPKRGPVPVTMPESADRLAIEQPLPERVKAAVPAVLAHFGYPAGDVTVTSVPDLTFFLEGHGKTWRVTYSPMTGGVSGSSDDVPEAEAMSVRTFLLRLHLAHGYPSSGGVRWYWAVIVDVMAGVMVFWGVSGLLMWWQIKSTRRIGAVILVASGVAATALGWGMYAVFLA